MLLTHHQSLKNIYKKDGKAPAVVNCREIKEPAAVNHQWNRWHLSAEKSIGSLLPKRS